MDLINLYILFIVTTSICSLYEIIIPAMQELAVYKPEDIVVKNKIVSYITFFIAGMLFAPMLILPCIIPSMGTRFKDSMVSSLRNS